MKTNIKKVHNAGEQLRTLENIYLSKLYHKVVKMKRQSPCLNCEYREVNCHSKCESYLNYKELLEKDKERAKEIEGYEFDKKFKMAIRRIRNKRRSF